MNVLFQFGVAIFCLDTFTKEVLHEPD